MNIARRCWRCVTDCCAWVKDAALALELQSVIMALGMTESRGVWAHMDEDALVSILGNKGEVGWLQIQHDCLHDARRFWWNAAIEEDGPKGIIDVYDQNESIWAIKIDAVKPGLGTLEEQTFVAIWYILGWHCKPCFSEMYPKLWHYGPSMTASNEDEEKQYLDRWKANLKIVKEVFQGRKS